MEGSCIVTLSSIAYPRSYLHNGLQALDDANREELHDPAPLEDAESDGGEPSGSDSDDEDEDEENSVDATTLVLGQSPPPEVVPGEHEDSTDNESRSPWEVTGETRAFKDMKREMESRGE